MELQPNRNISESVLHDRRSINLLKSILPDNCVDCSQLQEGGTLPNIDGYLEILDENGIAREKITVQVKHLTYPEKNGKVFYDIPESVYAYAKIHKGELVFFIACDYASRKFYWRNKSRCIVWRGGCFHKRECSGTFPDPDQATGRSAGKGQTAWNPV